MQAMPLPVFNHINHNHNHIATASDKALLGKSGLVHETSRMHACTIIAFKRNTFP